MNVSRRWLEALLDTALDLDATVERLAMLGAPVDAVEPLGGDLAEVVVGEVRSVAKHPEADRLSLCEVFDGAEVVEVVCGAPPDRGHAAGAGGMASVRRLVSCVPCSNSMTR